MQNIVSVQYKQPGKAQAEDKDDAAYYKIIKQRNSTKMRGGKQDFLIFAGLGTK